MTCSPIQSNTRAGGVYTRVRPKAIRNINNRVVDIPLLPTWLSDLQRPLAYSACMAIGSSGFSGIPLATAFCIVGYVGGKCFPPKESPIMAMGGICSTFLCIYFQVINPIMALGLYMEGATKFRSSEYDGGGGAMLEGLRQASILLTPWVSLGIGYLAAHNSSEN